MSGIKPTKGRLLSFQEGKEAKGKWGYYDMELEGQGVIKNVSVNTDKYTSDLGNFPENGKVVVLWPNGDNDKLFNYGGFDNPNFKKSSGGGGGSSSSGGGGNSTYWQDKYDYETKVKDPGLRFQGVFSKITDMYSAAITAGVPPSDADRWVEKAIAKANAICDKFCLKSGKFCYPDCSESCDAPDKSTDKKSVDF